MLAKNLDSFKLQFKNAVELQQTCKIYLATTEENSWSFYFQKGNLIWATSSVHRFRRLYRLTNQVCPELDCNKVKLREQEVSELWEYLLISVLQQRHQITSAQAETIVQTAIKEVLLDCLIAGDNITTVKTIFETEGNGMGAILRSPLFKVPLTKVDYSKIIGSLELLASDWNQLELGDCTPNDAPVVRDINKLSKSVKAELYQQIFCLINGQKTLRDLALASDQSLANLISCLLPQIENKAIALQAIPDRQLENLYFSGKAGTAAKYANSGRRSIQEDLPLVMIIDDNPHTCQKVIQILNPAGYRVISVNDIAKALLSLLDNQPDLIFIDADLPDANGYELCAQIGKMPALENVPVVILQGRKNIMDIVKAKMSGASELIDKPIETQNILVLAQKYNQNVVKA